jgi:hypothetical protein
VHPADRPVLGEPALAGGLVDLPPPVPALRPGDPLEDDRADPGAETIGSIQASHILIIGTREGRMWVVAASSPFGTLPVVDVSPLVTPEPAGQNLQAFTGTYGDYLLGKVSKVFPELRREVLTDTEP